MVTAVNGCPSSLQKTSFLLISKKTLIIYGNGAKQANRNCHNTTMKSTWKSWHLAPIAIQYWKKMENIFFFLSPNRQLLDRHTQSPMPRHFISHWSLLLAILFLLSSIQWWSLWSFSSFSNVGSLSSHSSSPSFAPFHSLSPFSSYDHFHPHLVTSLPKQQCNNNTNNITPNSSTPNPKQKHTTTLPQNQLQKPKNK